MRPDGGFYDPVKGLLGNDVLRGLRCTKNPKPVPILTGRRHVQIVKEAMGMLELVDSVDELQANLAGIRDNWCTDPASFPNNELGSIAEWAWNRRLNNCVYRGRDSAFSIQRNALDALRGQANGSDAIALFVTLADQHGHSPGKRFPLDFGAMRTAGLINLSTPRLRAARRTLERAGLVKLVSKHRVGSQPQLFILTRMNPGLSAPINITALLITQCANGRGK
jgi:hypothetical protein